MKPALLAKVTVTLQAMALAFALAVAPPVQAQPCPCVGDCDEAGGTDIGELQRCVNIVLNLLPVVNCPNCDADQNGTVEIGEVQQAVNSILFPATCPRVDCTTIPAICGNGVVEADEECDDGGGCRDGSNDGTLCTDDTSCTGGGTCQPAGADGCAVNCTFETMAAFTFTGAKCFGGAKDNELCTFKSSCNGGSKPGRPCAANADCPGGTCLSECGADSKGCLGDGECTEVGTGGVVGASCAVGAPVSVCSGGSNAGGACAIPPDCPGGACVARACTGGENADVPCTSNAECPGATCAAVCGGQGGLCLNRSRATLVSVSLPILIGPLMGQQTSHYGKAGPDGIIPIANPADGTTFEPVIVPGLACACVRGGEDPSAHGPGNSGSGVINCGAGTIMNEITLARDHSTLPPLTCTRGPFLCVGGTNNGGTCNPAQGDAGCPEGGLCQEDTSKFGQPCQNRCPAGGPRAGLPCGQAGIQPVGGDCGSGGSGQRQCNSLTDCGVNNACNASNGAGMCVGGTTAGRACFNNTQCPGGSCHGLCIAGANAGASCGCADAVGSCENTTQCGAAGWCRVVGARGGGFCMGPPRFCVGGTSPGKACFNAVECGAGGTCPGTGNFLAWCDDDADCPGSRCASPDDAECDNVDPPPPDGSGGSSCLEKQEFCTAGPLLGQPCTSNAFCGAGGSCGTQCNLTGFHASGPTVCNGPTQLTVSGAGGLGSALLLSTTAIGTILGPDDTGTCGFAALCTGGVAPGAPCLIDLDCPSGPCASAICNGFCTGTNPANKPCLSNLDCLGNGVCDPSGSAFNTKCTEAGPCGSNGTCVPVSVAKGFDGIPCTADDSDSAKGTPQTIPQTTGRSATFIADANANAGSQLVHLACIGGALEACISTVVGTPFDCESLTSGDPSPVGARLANSFPTLDGTTGDGVVTTFLTAR